MTHLLYVCRWEMTHQLDEDGTGQLQVKKSTYAAGGKPYASPMQARRHIRNCKLNPTS